MPQVLKDLFASKKFLAALSGILLVVINRIGLNIAEEVIDRILAMLAVFITGQGIADFGKEKAKTESASNLKEGVK